MANLEERQSRGTKSNFFYGYIIVAACFGLQMMIWGLFLSFGVFLKPLVYQFGWSRAVISGASSLSLFFSGVTSIFFGSLNDRYGPRMIMTACGFFLGLGCLLTSQINAIWQLYLFYGVLVGIGISGADVVLLSTVARWFVKKRGMMSGVIMAGTGLGILIMPLVASSLISIYGWRISYIILGTLALLVVISVAQLLRRDPGQMKQLPDGEQKIAFGSLDSAEGGLSLREAIYTRQFWTICTIFLAISLCANVVLIHIVPHAVDIGISTITAAGVLSTIGGASIAGRLIMGSTGDRVGNKWAVIVSLLVFVAAFIWLLVAKELWMLYVFAAAYGFAHGGFFAVGSPLVAELFGISSHGLIFGIVFFSGTIGGAIGPFVAGYIFDVTGSYQVAFVACAAIVIFGLILTMLLTPITDKHG